MSYPHQAGTNIIAGPIGEEGRAGGRWVGAEKGELYESIPSRAPDDEFL